MRSGSDVLRWWMSSKPASGRWKPILPCAVSASVGGRTWLGQGGAGREASWTAAPCARARWARWRGYVHPISVAREVMARAASRVPGGRRRSAGSRRRSAWSSGDFTRTQDYVACGSAGTT